MALLKLAETFDARFNEIRQAAYLQSLADLSATAVEYAVDETIRQEIFFPVPAKLREYAGCYRSPAVTSVSRLQIPEDCTPPEVALERLREVSALLNGRFGTSLDIAADPVGGRPRLKVVRKFAAG